MSTTLLVAIAIFAVLLTAAVAGAIAYKQLQERFPKWFGRQPIDEPQLRRELERLQREAGPFVADQEAVKQAENLLGTALQAVDTSTKLLGGLETLPNLKTVTKNQKALWQKVGTLKRTLEGLAEQVGLEPPSPPPAKDGNHGKSNTGKSSSNGNGKSSPGEGSIFLQLKKVKEDLEGEDRKAFLTNLGNVMTKNPRIAWSGSGSPAEAFRDLEGELQKQVLEEVKTLSSGYKTAITKVFG